MARKHRRIVEGVVYEWGSPYAEHEADDAIPVEVEPMSEVTRHEWSFEFCEGMQEMCRQGLRELLEALSDYVLEQESSNEG